MKNDHGGGGELLKLSWCGVVEKISKCHAGGGLAMYPTENYLTLNVIGRRGGVVENQMSWGGG